MGAKALPVDPPCHWLRSGIHLPQSHAKTPGQAISAPLRPLAGFGSPKHAGTIGFSCLLRRSCAQIGCQPNSPRSKIPLHSESDFTIGNAFSFGIVLVVTRLLRARQRALTPPGLRARPSALMQRCGMLTAELLEPRRQTHCLRGSGMVQGLAAAGRWSGLGEARRENRPGGPGLSAPPARSYISGRCGH